MGWRRVTPPIHDEILASVRRRERILIALDGCGEDVEANVTFMFPHRVARNRALATRVMEADGLGRGRKLRPKP